MQNDQPLPPEALSPLVSIALSRPDLSVLREMLLEVARQLDAYGCALWQTEPHLPGTRKLGPEEDPGEEKILAAAAGFRDRLHYPEHDLPATIPSGRAMKEGVVAIADLSQTDLPPRGKEFLRHTGVRSLCSVPACLADRRAGSLTVYRQRTGDWLPHEIRLLEYFAGHIPSLYRAVRDRVGFRLLEEVSSIIREAEEDPNALPAAAQPKLQQVCEAIAHGFQCLETSIYLESPLERPGIYQKVATTCPELVHREQYHKDQAGLTPWAARHGAIAVVDVREFDQSQYEGLQWQDEVNLEANVRALLKLDPTDPTPPISFMAVPIRLGKTVFGVVRCCAATEAPFYFARRETDLLEIIASRIGHFWSNLVGRQDLRRELSMWRRFVNAVSHFHKSLQDDLTQRRILQSALDVARESLPDAAYVDISLFDSDKKEMVLASPHGPRVAYKVDENPPRTPAAIVYRTRSAFRVTSDLRGASFGSAYKDVKRAIYAPILADGDFLGMIAVRGTGDVDYPAQANQVLDLLGHLTGLYLQLQGAILKQTQTYEDFLHQLRNPVFMAQKRAGALRADTENRALDAICGLLGKARRLVINLRLFADLAAGKEIEPDFRSLGPGDLVRPLIELASDNRILWQHRKIGFFVETESFEFNAALQVDMDLFEQAAGNILDNSGKYGTPNQRATIAAALVAGREVRIAFRGKSIPISREDAGNVGKRGWRGREAQMRSAEGSGIGLWMAARIMRAHHGRLEVFPTDADGYNEIRLVFPVVKP